MLKFEEYLRLNGLDNKVHEYQEGKPVYTLDDYYYDYGKEYIHYVNACISATREEKIF